MRGLYNNVNWLRVVGLYIPDCNYWVVYTPDDNGEWIVCLSEFDCLAVVHRGDNFKYEAKVCFLPKRMIGMTVRREVFVQSNWLDTAHLMAP